METIESIASKLKNFRVNAGYTLEQFAEKTGMNKGNLSKIENGKQSIGMTVLLRMLNALNGEIELFSPFIRNTVRFYKNVSTVYLIKEDRMEYLLTKPALKAKLDDLTQHTPYLLIDLFYACDTFEDRHGKRFYKYSIDDFMVSMEKTNGFIPEVKVIYVYDNLLDEPVEKWITLKSIPLHE